MMRGAIVIGVAALLAVTACDGATGGGGHQPAADVRHVWSDGFGDAVLYDVAVSGEHIAVIFHAGASILAISHDGGESFATYDYLPRPDEYVTTEAGLGGVMIGPDGQVFLIIRYEGFAPPLGAVVSFTLQRFDEASGTYDGRPGAAVGGGTWARIEGTRLETYYRINAGDAFVLNALDGTTGQSLEGAAHAPPEEPRCFGVQFAPDPRHNSFVATCPDRALTCFASADPQPDSPSSLRPTLRCVSTDQLRAPRHAAEDIYANLAMYDLGGSVFGEGPAPGGVERVDFGPGTVLPRYRKRVRVPFARYLPIGAPDLEDPATAREVARLIHVPPRGEWREPTFPRHPCEGECEPAPLPQLRYGSLLWLAPLAEADTFLAFYGIRDDAGHHFYMRRVVDRAETPGPSTSAPGSLEQTCARLAACFPGVYGADLRSCLFTFSMMRGRTAEQDRAYQAFLATPEGDCDAFLETVAGAWDAAESCTPGCFGGVAVECHEGPSGPVSRVNCNELGVDCRVDAATSRPVCGEELACVDENRCDGERMVSCIGDYRVTDCGAMGALCDVGGGCVLDEPCADGVGRCDGDVLLSNSCIGERRAFGYDVDCSRLGLSCDPVQLACTTGRAAVCADGEAPTCDGTRLVYCLGGEMRQLDCASIGYSTCGLVDYVGTCQ